MKNRFYLILLAGNIAFVLIFRMFYTSYSDLVRGELKVRVNSAIRMSERYGADNDTARLNTLISSGVISGYYLPDKDAFSGSIDMTAKDRTQDIREKKELYRQNTIYIYVRMSDDGAAVIYGSLSNTQWRKGIMNMFIALGLLMLSLNLLFFGLTHIFLIKPISELARTANAIRSGEYDRQFGSGGSSEVRMLAESIKGMTATIRKDIEILNIVIDNMRIGFVLFDARGIVTLSNREAQRVFGMNRDDDIGVSIPALKSGLGGVAHRLYTASRLVKKTGEPVYADIAVYKVGGNGNDMYVAVFRESERMPSKSNNELTRFMNSLASMMAHEIKNPLNVISMVLNLAEKKYGRDEMFGDIAAEIRKLTEVTDLFADIMSSSPSRIRLADALRPLFEKWERLFDERGIGFKWDVDEEAVILFDRQKLDMIFTNLLKNSYEKGRGAGVRVAVARQLGKVHIDIEDTGKGVERDTLSGLFSGVFSTKGSERGWGIPLIRMFLNASGGNMEMGPGGNAGTRIRLVFDYDENTDS